jgi:hypothetical protein
MGDMRNAYKILVRIPERKRLLRRPRCRWDNQDRNQWQAPVDMIMNLQVSKKLGTFLTS